MDERTRTLLDELKDVVLELHRSAGQLDSVIQNIESELHSSSDRDYLDALISQMLRYRIDVKNYREYNKLDTRELSIWNQLIESRLRQREEV